MLSLDGEINTLTLGHERATQALSGCRIWERAFVAPLQPLANLSGQVTEILALKILSGEFPVGTSLPTEGRLQTDLGVSRTTLREAVKKLTSKGLLLVGPSKGTRVRAHEDWNLLDPELLRWRLQLGVTTKLIQDMYELRECFEPAAGRLAAERASDDDRTAMKSAYAALEASREVGGESSVDADVSFHTAILRSAKNELIASLATVMESTLRASFIVARHRVNLSVDDLALHEAVLKAILKGDGRSAQRATERLLAESKSVQMEAAAASTKRPSLRGK